jgi:transcriptional regulator with XRE-family HTH domain
MVLSMRVGDYLKAVGVVVRDARSARGLSQEALAEKAKISRNMVSLIETGAGNASLRKLVDLSNALKTTPADLLAEAERRFR